MRRYNVERWDEEAGWVKVGEQIPAPNRLKAVEIVVADLSQGMQDGTFRAIPRP